MVSSYQKRKTFGLPGREPEEDSVEAQLYELNRRASPFLRLPPEIRNKIYLLLLGGGQIFVYNGMRREAVHAYGALASPSPSRRAIAAEQHAAALGTEAESRSAATAAGSVPSGASLATAQPRDFPHRMLPYLTYILLPVEQLPFRYGRARHQRTCAAGLCGEQHGRVTLLSRVCRQLYRETALLPFVLNVWTFHDRRVAERFVLRDKTLAMIQRRAMESVLCSEPLGKAIENKFARAAIIVVAQGDKDGWKHGVKLLAR